jgi:hypothetical protein
MSNTAIHYGETLMLDGLIPPVGVVGDPLDNALREDKGALHTPQTATVNSHR